MRKNIALFVSFLDNEFSMDVIDGAWMAAEEKDINLFIMPTRLLIDNYYNQSVSQYEYQNNTILSYIDPNNFDGVIIETGIICNGMPDEELTRLFANYAPLPVVTISRKVPGYPNVSFHNRGLEDELQHLIDRHHCKRIGFIGGPENNQEAAERFALYKKVLTDNGLDFDDSLYGMGNFSEFCEEAVQKVIEDNAGKLDALCFANDRMAIGGYAVIKSMGLTVGKDICVTGFDDAKSAAAMEPMLTTVRSNISALGYRAVELCISMANGMPGKDVNVDTALVVRSSCGCPSSVQVILNKIEAAGTADRVDSNELCTEIRHFLFGALGNESRWNQNADRILYQAFSTLLQNLTQPDFRIAENTELVLNAIAQLDFNIIPHDEFMFALNLIRKKGIAVAPDHSMAEDFFFDLFISISNNKFASAYEQRQEIRSIAQTSNHIIHDVLANINDEAASYFSIIQNIHEHKTHSCYLYMHEFPISCYAANCWHRPRAERLICYQDGEREILLPPEEQKIPSDCIFRNLYMPDRSHVFVVNLLYYNEENYGLLFCETDRKDYNYLAWTVPQQISYALKMKYLIEEQTAIQERLSKSMEQIKSYNMDLHKKTISDELTGIFNRRGFIELVGDALRDPGNVGKRAVIAFADMNHLKTINDQFGHDDGDFAIRGLAQILQSCFRTDDIVARFGGDEFAMFCFSHSNHFESCYRQRIAKVTEQFNATSGKPYLVTASTGVYEFTCDTQTNLSECMNIADALLYEDKKNKPATIIRAAAH